MPVRLVIADTTPLNYLILIQQIQLLPTLFERVFIPAAVRDELRHNDAPTVVREWVAVLPAWLEVTDPTTRTTDPTLDRLDEGERAAIQLARRAGRFDP